MRGPLVQLVRLSRSGFVFLLLLRKLAAFTPQGFSQTQRLSASVTSSRIGSKSSTSLLRETQTVDELSGSYDPLGLATLGDYVQRGEAIRERVGARLNGREASKPNPVSALSTAALSATLATSFSDKAWAESAISKGSLDPESFQPVCPASDGFYRFLQGSTEAVVGQENFLEYGPLIAGGLLRVRLELCVVESFFAEAVLPFIQQKGLGWVLPLHETVETFLAGVIFALAATFILVGSTKILTVIITYTDFFIGGPFRLFGGFANDRAMGKPVTLDIGLGPWKKRIVGPPDSSQNEDLSETGMTQLVVVAVSGGVRVIGQAIGIGRQALEALDTFVGRYLVIWVTGYIAIKFVHFKVFPDFP